MIRAVPNHDKVAISVHCHIRRLLHVGRGLVDQKLVSGREGIQHADPAVLERAAKGDGSLHVTNDIFQIPITTKIGVPRIVGTCGNVTIAKRA